MIPTKTEARDLFYPAALAAYRQPGEPYILPDVFQWTADIRVGLLASRALLAEYAPLLNSMLKAGVSFGYVAVDSVSGAILVSFRGSESPQDWLSDIESFPVLCSTVGNVHEGFQHLYDAVRESAINAVRAAVRDATGVPLLVTGHSLGAALASLFAVDMTLLLGLSPRVCTFGSPRVATTLFARQYGRSVPDTLRVVNRWDIVPHVPIFGPPPFDFEHFGQLLVIDSGFTLDLLRGHGLTTGYLPGLLKK